jgi:peptide/nickel transport system substrate-binding protein
MRALSLLAATGLVALAAAADAQTLRIALSAQPSSADPHHYALTPNSTLRDHVYDGLTRVDAGLRVQPALAASWERRDDLTWVFRLREGVRFQDGAPFGAGDVVFSYCRVLNNESELVGSFSSIVKRLAKVEAEGDGAVAITTAEPNPLLPSDLSSVAIIPRTLAPHEGLRFSPDGCGVKGPWPALAQFNDGSAAIGTGPYRLARFTTGGAIELARHEGYWGPKPHWAGVRLLPVTQAGPRLAGLLAGDHDVIEFPATGDLPRLRENGNVRLAVAPSTRLIFLQLDFREPAPFVNGGAAPNPLRDVRVRQALSLAIDRRAIAERIMDGVATPAAQFLPDGMRGTVEGLPVLPYDPARARALLAEAGYPNGFTLTLHATNNRYVNDTRVIQAVAQYFQRIGVRAEVDAMPSTTFFPRRGRAEFSVAMGGWAAGAEETMLFFRAWLVTQDRAKGFGMSNYGHWSNPDFDRPALASFETMDDAKRVALMQEATKVALGEMPVIPLQFESGVWAFRRGLAFAGRVDQTTPAMDIRPE